MENLTPKTRAFKALATGLNRRAVAAALRSPPPDAGPSGASRSFRWRNIMTEQARNLFKSCAGAYPPHPMHGPQSAGKNNKEKIHSKNRRPIDFERINRVALVVLPSLLARWLPGGRIEGTEYVALNPTRADRHLGSFRINLSSGKWADFATRAGGRDTVALAAYLFRLNQIEAAEKLAGMLGIEARHGR